MGYDENTIEDEVADFEFLRKVERETSSPVLAKNLSQLTAIWAAVRDVLGFSSYDAVWFVHERICELKPRLYTDPNHDNALQRAYLLGWEPGFANGSSMNSRLILKASESRFAEDWGCTAVPDWAQADDDWALHLYLAPLDAESIIGAANAIAQAEPVSLRTTTRGTDSLQNYPDKLRAAIEAFEAVSRDPAATARQSAKAALAAWLAEHKPELSSNARDSIATVANWQPQGGAPKTPG